MTDIAIIGAGISGLVCAQQLRQAGYGVVVVEKSRGVGGRVATRRFQGTCADHGACYLKPQGKLLSQFVDLLQHRQIIEVWTDTVHEFSASEGISQPANLSPRYTAPQGMSAIAKFLTPGLDILLNQRVVKINFTPENTWLLTSESNEQFHTKALVVAIPAPQAEDLLAPLGAGLLGAEFLNHLRSVEFYPCISVMAGYSPDSQPLPDWKALTFNDHADLAWIGFDSSKRTQAEQPHFVLQSSASFAQQHLESENLQSVGNYMLQTAAKNLTLPWLENPEWMQVHRWRYAFPRTPLDVACLSAASPLPLVCCGDWCGGNLVGGAMVSGLAAAAEIDQQLRHLLPENGDFLDFFDQSV
ncbi:FAD-dependent oxidoreductase [Sphaerospermopsis aphanizomenoides BCCUSP55]|uniref:NAD(P)/FAD-dependent oxidoreductase n=1 Tax=Sphaerospermopsis aphanizomenoides TaxID=459663 RepID=UPI00190588B7|nr:FAD-dependent oxidoreductase [Sphaerospermopsis aphanizomenoides]MBK1989816.1 FAD-dependent oxidoreductase [Sphaerospermopsis aphanizomenoides BCCUSP55]